MVARKSYLSSRKSYTVIFVLSSIVMGLSLAISISGLLPIYSLVGLTDNDPRANAILHRAQVAVHIGSAGVLMALLLAVLGVVLLLRSKKVVEPHNCD